MNPDRWPLYEYQRYVWESQLCTDHKMVVIAVLSFMTRERLFAFPGVTQIVKRTSMSNTKVSRLLGALRDADWLKKGPAPAGELEGPGREPHTYYTPRRDVLPQVLPHCVNRRQARTANLYRGKPTPVGSSCTSDDER